MVRHIVMWKLKPEGNGVTKEENAKAIKTKLESLVGQIEGLIKAEVGINFNPKGFDLCLYSEFTDNNALNYYQDHPLHQEVRGYVHGAVCERACVDSFID